MTSQMITPLTKDMQLWKQWDMGCCLRDSRSKSKIGTATQEGGNRHPHRLACVGMAQEEFDEQNRQFRMNKAL